jgi:hypothetical protein
MSRDRDHIEDRLERSFRRDRHRALVELLVFAIIGTAAVVVILGRPFDGVSGLLWLVAFFSLAAVQNTMSDLWRWTS